MKLAKIENGEIKIFNAEGSLKVNNKLLTPIEKFTTEQLLEHGIYKVQRKNTERNQWQMFGEEILELVDDVVLISNEVIDIPLEDLKEAKNLEIKNTLIEIKSEGFVCSNEIKVDCRDSDRFNWDFAFRNDNLKTTVKDFNNELHQTTIEEFDIMYGELMQHYIKLNNDKWKLNELVRIVETANELEEIFWRKAKYSESEDLIPVFEGWDYHSSLVD